MADGLNLRRELRELIERKYETQTKAAKEWGLSESYVSMVLRGHKPPSKAMLAEIGVVREIVYRRATPPAPSTAPSDELPPLKAALRDARAWIVENPPAITLSRQSTIDRYLSLLDHIDSALANKKGT